MIKADNNPTGKPLNLCKHNILKTQFGYESFRPGQEAAIDALLSGSDVLAVMPTGAGKSLCYQIPALLLPGMTIVISPLISLMKDQVNALRESGCTAAFLNSSLTSSEYKQTMNEIRQGRLKLLYIAPERLQRMDFLSETIPMIVIDEAHCVSQWGHDFRTSYLEIANFIRNINPRPVIAAFTATATQKVKMDIQRLLALQNPVSVNTGFDRPNLYFEVQKPGNKKTALLECLEKRSGASGIVYCSTRKAVDELYEDLPQYGFSVTRYHAGLDDNQRRKNQDDFVYDRKQIMIATNAFGMGIDKSNVNFVIHYNMPKNIESYYQEAGRAGRDGTQADCILLYNGQDVRINEFLIKQNNEDREHNPVLLEHNRKLLKLITFYATGKECLRHRLLSYFGENTSSFCGNCSNCQSKKEDQRIYVKLSAEKTPHEKYHEPSAGKPKTTFKDTELMSAIDKALFEKLKELRKKLAAKENVPAYIVFSDANLRDMCRKKPVSLVQFSAVNGVGAVKLEKYGEMFIEVISAAI